MDYIKRSLLLFFILFLSTTGYSQTRKEKREARKKARIERRAERKKKKLELYYSVYYSRSYNHWNQNSWTGNVFSATISNNQGLPSVGYWYDPITKANGISFGIKLIGGKII